VQLPQEEDIKYLGLHLDRRLIWHKYILEKRKQPGITSPKYIGYSDTNQNSPQATNNLDLRNTTLGMASTSNIEILERFQSKALRMMVDTPWYMPNTVIGRDLHG
jgi:hypothetical protein